MSDRHLLFCPYLFLPNFLDRPIKFADWELAPLRFFEGRWSSPRFKNQAIAFLRKFVEPYDDRPIEPALLCRESKQLDGRKPSDEEVRALELSLAFASIDCNPRRDLLENSDRKHATRTTENAELHLWSIGDGNIIINTGHLVPNWSYCQMLCMETSGGDLILPDSVDEFHIFNDLTQAAIAL